MFEGLTIKEITELYRNSPNLVKALVKAMSEIESIDKNSTVRTGGNGFYKAVQDKDVKIAVRKVLTENGLIIVPAIIDATTERIEKDKNGYKSTDIFVNCKTTFMIMHDSGEAIPAQGIGHGIDNLDKAAGKATTYALKYFELYLFQVATGHIDDADKTEPDSNEQQPTTKAQQQPNKQQTQAASQTQSQAQKTKEDKKEEVKTDRDAKTVSEYLLASTTMAELTKRWNELSVEERKVGKEAKDKKKTELSPSK